MSTVKTSRFPFLIIAVVSLIVGLFAGLARIGWNTLSFPGMMHHGGIMVGGFLGTLISLEKIIPLKKKWLYLIPVTSALSLVFFVTGLPLYSFLLLLAASVGLSFVFLLYFLKERSLIYAIMFAGSLSWACGNVLIASEEFYPLAVPWWMAFILLIISAERLELMKFLPVSRKQKLVFTLFLALFVVGAILTFHGFGSLVGGASLIACAAWLLRFDLIRITLRKEGLTRFVAVALLTGYVSLVLSGIFMIHFSAEAFAYDSMVHAFFLGFTLAMIFAHGPIILPGVIGSSVKPFSVVLYIWLGLLHASWLLRIAGAVFYEFDWRKTSGMLSAIAIAGYFVTLMVLTARKINAQKQQRMKHVSSTT
jgi:hypothetical protein